MTHNGTKAAYDDNCTYKLEIVLFSLRDFPGWYKIVISYRRAIKKTAVHYVCPYATPDWQKNESIYCCFQAMLINFSRKSGPLRLAKKNTFAAVGIDQAPSQVGERWETDMEDNFPP